MKISFSKFLFFASFMYFLSMAASCGGPPISNPTGPSAESLIPPNTVTFTPEGQVESPTKEFTDQPTSTLVVNPTITPTETQPSLDAFDYLPQWLLNVDNNWEYSSLIYAEEYTVTYRITDKVLETRLLAGHFAAKINRQVQYLTGDPEVIFLGSRLPGVYWVVVEDGYVYSQEELNPDNLQNADLDYIFPLRENLCWFLDPERRANFPPESCNYGVLQGPIHIETRAGSFDNCFWIVGHYVSGGTQEWFCEGIGKVRTKYDHNGTPFGYAEELIHYSIDGPQR